MKKCHQIAEREHCVYPPPLGVKGVGEEQIVALPQKLLLKIPFYFFHFDYVQERKQMYMLSATLLKKKKDEREEGKEEGRKKRRRRRLYSQITCLLKLTFLYVSGFSLGVPSMLGWIIH